MQKTKNPILPGGYPDPSIVRVGEDFYLVNSTFEYFPGLPIHHSRDLVNWELIGHALHRPSQCTGEVCLTDVQSDGGIHAPTIRYHNGKFYIITTNVYVSPQGDTSREVCTNFIVTAENPAGPWSDPIVIKGAPGIDPDIFFDDDGTIWYVGTHTPENKNYDSEGEIWTQQLDPQTFQLIGERHFLWRGTGGDWVEGPHMYKRNGRYYLMTAEGGTGFFHAVTIASSESITGPFVSNPRNPILTSRHLSNQNWVHSTGHGDLVELQDGCWYMVCLGVRNHVANRSNMGRETFLLPVVWEEQFPGSGIEWPVCSPEVGCVEQYLKTPFEQTVQKRTLSFADDFSGSTLSAHWNYRRVPVLPRIEMLSSEQKLRLFADSQPFADNRQTAFIGFRQLSSAFAYSAEVMIDEGQTTEGGLAIVQKDHRHLTFTRQVVDDSIQLNVKVNSALVCKKRIALASTQKLTLVIEGQGEHYQFHCLVNGESIEVGEWSGEDLVSFFYTGAYCGLVSFVQSDKQNKHWTDFAAVRFIGHEE